VIVGKSEMLIFDLSGRSSKLWPHYFENLDGLIYVLDANNFSKEQVNNQLL
jgi:hypothetical protein